MVNDVLGNIWKSYNITTSAILVHSIMSGDTETMNEMLKGGSADVDLTGMSGKNLLSLHEKVTEQGEELTYDWNKKIYVIK